MASQSTTVDAGRIVAELKPIQDLAKNFDIEIAAFLDDYLNDLVGDAILEDADENNENVNTNKWAKAAMVLQNSSMCYSRKVEYLYNQVLAALERMSRKGAHNSNKANNKKRAGYDEEVEDFFDFDPHQEFLLLDDVLPLDTSENGKHINLPESSEEAELTRRLTLDQTRRSTSLGGGELSSTTPNRTTLTAGATRTLSSTLRNNPHHNNASAWLGNNLVNATGGSGATSGALRLMNGVCELDESGRLILPGSQTRTSLPKEGTEPDTPMAMEGEFAAAYDDNNDDDGMAMSMGGGYGDDNDGPGFELNDIENKPPSQIIAPKRVQFAPDKPDPWALLDPHEPMKSSASSKPLKLGKTIRLPERLRTKKSSNASTLKQTHNKSKPRCLTVECFRHFMDPEGTEEPYVPWKGSVYGSEFADIARRKQAQRNAEKRRQRLLQQGEEAPPLMSDDAPPPFSNHDDDYDDDNDGGYMDGVMDDDDWGDNDDGGVMETNTGLVSVDQLYNRGDTDTDETDSVRDKRTFEELCRAHIAAFARGAEKYAASTNLTRRVDEWQNRLKPILEQEETRAAFDIFTYSQDVVRALEGCKKGDKKSSNDLMADDDSDVEDDSPTVDKKRIDFAQVVKGKEPHDVCRMFLATLSLCNSGNVTLYQAKSTGNVVKQPLEMSLLSTDIERPMETYLALSAEVDAMIEQ